VTGPGPANPRPGGVPPPPASPKPLEPRPISPKPKAWLVELPYVALLLFGVLVYGSAMGILLAEWAVNR
jgi:hypothetical protein